MNYKIIVFQTTHHVLKSEKILEKAGFKFDIIPTPKKFSSDCGMSIRVDVQVTNIEDITKILEENNLTFKVYEI